MVTVAATSLQPDVDVSQASRHLELLHHDAPGFASIVLLGNARHERHCFFATGDLVDSPGTYDESREALQDVVDNRWNVYTAMSTFTTVPAKGRGTRADVLSVPGVWADLDVKPDVEGYFATEDDLLAYVGRLPKPTLEIASGSGGRHLYWLTHERLEAKRGQNLLLAWLDFLRSEASGIIENVHDTTRVLRLAGTVRWPKAGNDTTPMPHKVELLHEGPRYHTEELQLLAHEAHDLARARRDETRAQRTTAEQRNRHELASRGLQEANYDRVVRLFNIQQDWAPLLEGTGWTLHSDQRDGPASCRYWTRPGKSTVDGKSAATDFTSYARGTAYSDAFAAAVGPRSNDVWTSTPIMTIYTNDPALDDIRDSGGDVASIGTCNKWDYTLKRLFNGDEVSLLRCVVANRGKLT